MSQHSRKFFQKLISIGVLDSNSVEFNNKLRLVNVFIWLCILFCFPYYITFLVIGEFNLAIIFIISQVLYALSLIANRDGYYNTAKYLIIISTNYAVLTMNFAFGYEAGFLRYYFAAPLVIFTLFNYRQTAHIVLGMSLYMSSFVIGEIFYLMGVPALLDFSPEILSNLRLMNIFATLLFLTMLAMGFSKQYYRSYKALAEQHKNLQKLIGEKNTLLSETHHRVKNNLAVISGLFDLQMIYNQNAEVSEILNNSKRRIKSMSMIHESLYRQDDLANIDFKQYISQMVREIESSIKTNPDIEVKLNVQELHFDLQHAVPLGLIVNEVLTNAFKHAFQPNQKGEIIVEFKKEEKFILRIIDNGKGLPSEMDSGSLGMTLIDALVQQLEGEYCYKTNHGTTFEMQF
jgi:two-component sensor histidine kinase